MFVLPTLGVAVALGVLAILGFPGETLAEVGIVAGSGLVAVALYWVGGLAWAWLQAPHHLVLDELTAIRGALEARPVEATEDRELRKWALLATSDLEDCRALLERGLRDNKYWDVSAPSGKWSDAESVLASDRRAGRAHKAAREAFRAIAPLNDRAMNVWAIVNRGGTPRTAPGPEQQGEIGDAIKLIDNALQELEALAQELDPS